jgi:hypothetical protein
MKAVRAISKVAIATVLASGMLVAATGAQAKRKVDAVTISCQGDTLTGSATVSATHGANVRLSVHAGEQRGSLQPSRMVRQLTVPAGRDGYTFTFDVASLGASFYGVRAMHGEKQVDSNVIDASTCAPGAVVPEAPAALLLPLSALGTVGIAIGASTVLRRRRTAA